MDLEVKAEATICPRMMPRPIWRNRNLLGGGQACFEQRGPSWAQLTDTQRIETGHSNANFCGIVWLMVWFL